MRKVFFMVAGIIIMASVVFATCPINYGVVQIQNDAIIVPDCYDVVYVRPQQGVGFSDILKNITCTRMKTVILQLDDYRSQVIVTETGNIVLAEEHVGVFYLDNESDTLTLLCNQTGAVEVSSSDNGPPEIS